MLIFEIPPPQNISFDFLNLQHFLIYFFKIKLCPLFQKDLNYEWNWKLNLFFLFYWMYVVLEIYNIKIWTRKSQIFINIKNCYKLKINLIFFKIHKFYLSIWNNLSEKSESRTQHKFFSSCFRSLFFSHIA